MKFTRFCSALMLAAVIFSNAAHAEFNINLRTTTADTGTVTTTTRLYNQGAPGGPGVDPSETTDRLWFVIDRDGDGIFKPGALTGLNYDGTLNGLISGMLDADDYVFQGTVNSGVEGRTLQPVTLPSNAQTGGSGPADIGGTVKAGYAILFNSANLLNGGTFGFDQVVYNNADGSTVIPPSGNLNARIGQDVYANTYTFTVGNNPPLPPQPKITNLVAQVTSTNVVFGLSFLTAASASYRIESTTNLAIVPIQWSNELSVIVGNGSVTNVSITNGPPLVPSKFFRIRGY